MSNYNVKMMKEIKEKAMKRNSKRFGKKTNFKRKSLDK